MKWTHLALMRTARITFDLSTKEAGDVVNYLLTTREDINAISENDVIELMDEYLLTRE